MPTTVSRDELTQERLVSARAGSGLRVRILDKPSLVQTCALLAIDFGSTHDAFVPAGGRRAVNLPAGLAHFLEHKMFEKPEGDLFERFAAEGAHANAMTGHTMTGYFFIATSDVEKHLDTLLETCFAPHFTDALVKKEFGIIDQEIRGYDDSPAWRSWRSLLENLYWKHPAREDIAGTSESIRKIDADLLRRVHEAFYVPRNMVLAIAGSADLDQVLARVDAHLGRSPVGGPPARIRRVNEPERIRRRHSTLEMEVAMPRLLLGFKGPGGRLTPKESLLHDAAATLFLDVLLGDAGPLHEALYEEGLIADDFGWSVTLEDDFGYAHAGGQTPDPERLGNRILEAMEQALEEPLDSERLAAAKRRQIGDAVRMFDHPETLAWSLAESTLRGESLFAWPRVVEGLGERALRRRARAFFARDRATRVALLPRGTSGRGRR